MSPDGSDGSPRGDETSEQLLVQARLRACRLADELARRAEELRSATESTSLSADSSAQGQALLARAIAAARAVAAAGAQSPPTDPPSR